MNISKQENTEEAFVFASLKEFIRVWRSGRQASLTLECKEGKTSLNFQVSLGRPDQSHFQDGRGQRRKSARRRQKNNARAAAFQAARAASAGPPAVPPSPAALLPAGQDEEENLVPVLALSPDPELPPAGREEEGDQELDVPAPVPPVPPSTGEDQGESPALRPSTPSSHPPPLSCTPPLPTISQRELQFSFPASSGEPEQENEAASNETRTGYRFDLNEEAGEEETMETEEDEAKARRTQIAPEFWELSLMRQQQHS